MAETLSVGSTIMSKFDELLSDYAQKRRLTDGDGDIFGKETGELGIQKKGVSCQFRERCYAARFGTGRCPCELRVT